MITVWEWSCFEKIKRTARASEARTAGEMRGRVSFQSLYGGSSICILSTLWIARRGRRAGVERGPRPYVLCIIPIPRIASM